MTAPAGFLVLDDGAIFRGRSVGAPGVVAGEAVFTTAMTGYQETVTDPSYAEQIVCFTAPMVGNYGVSPARLESGRAHARAVLMRSATGEEWPRWLAGEGLVALAEIDTRALVLRLRTGGARRALAVSEEAGLGADEALALVLEQPAMAGRALVAGVSGRTPYRLGQGDVRVAVLDFGCKRSILARLVGAGVEATVWPHDTDAETVLGSRPRGVLLSNGPGDPAALADELGTVRDLLGRVPILGICLGHQLLGLAAGFPTHKLPFGHRGTNHPVLDEGAGRVLVTSQNHGFAVAGDGPAVTHRSLYDGTVEGLALSGEHARSLQFHPEASPGPHDARPLIAGWVDELRTARPTRAKAA